MKRSIAAIFISLATVSFAQDRTIRDCFFANDSILDQQVDSILVELNAHERVAQLIMPAVGKYGQTQSIIEGLIKQKKIGGVLLLNGTKDQFKNWTNHFNSINSELGGLPFLYSADAEPSLVNRKMKGSTPVKKAIDINSMEDVYVCAKTISDDLNEVGINYNFAPVVDVAKNSTVGYRGFGADPENIIPFSLAFIEQTQNQNIIATAKHFPGHGLVSGDTHKSLQVIDGELKELKYYPPLIERGVLSVMVAHIAVKNNNEFDTDGLPATTSRKIVTELLRDSLGFDGLIVTDAMNMGGVVNVPNCYLKAINAGCDILLMPKDANKAHSEILSEYKINPTFASQVDESVKRLIRMKICLGIL